ncbi:hypothetical protein ABW19_dt0203688 [Dactylella cylindrospora]|nr:hypothetical protein ABW19_dt0203688 [Dactylella cylindrospora]
MPPRKHTVHDMSSTFLGIIGIVVEIQYEDKNMDKLIEEFDWLIEASAVIYGLSWPKRQASHQMNSVQTRGETSEATSLKSPIKRWWAPTDFGLPKALESNTDTLVDRSLSAVNWDLYKRGSKGEISISKRDDGVPEIIGDRNAFPELVALSQPPKVGLKVMRSTYWHDKNAGKGVSVYVLDSGCDPTHPVRLSAVA